MHHVNTLKHENKYHHLKYVTTRTYKNFQAIQHWQGSPTKMYSFKKYNTCKTLYQNVTEFILSDNCSTCFRHHYYPSSGAQNNCNYSIR